MLECSCESLHVQWMKCIDLNMEVDVEYGLITEEQAGTQQRKG